MNTTVGRVAVLAAVSSATAAGSFLRVEKRFGEWIVFDFQSRYLPSNSKFR
jgi:hypothetical protein